MKGIIKKIMTGGMVILGVLSVFSNTTLAEGTIIEEWAHVTAPAAPELKPVKIDPQNAALLILDIEKRTCNPERRPRCIASVPRIKSLLEHVQ